MRPPMDAVDYLIAGGFIALIVVLFVSLSLVLG
jgi:hypothetical protein